MSNFRINEEKLHLSSVFSKSVKEFSKNYILPKKDFSNADLIECGNHIAKNIVGDLGPKEIHALMSFNTSSVDYIIFSREQEPDIPDTPYSGVIANKELIEPILFLTSLHSLMGLHPVVYQGENDGRLVRHVVPAEKSVGSISSHGSRVAFAGHVDNPDLPFFDNAEEHKVSIPDNLSLYCLRQQDVSVPTDIIFLDKILDRLGPEKTSLLMKPLFTVERPASFSGYAGLHISDVPLISRNNLGQYISRIDTHRITTTDKKSESIIEEFKAIAASDDVKLRLVLQPGECVIFKNKRVLHAREAFNPRFDGKDRWLLRILSVNSKPPTEILVAPDDPTHLKTDIIAFNL